MVHPASGEEQAAAATRGAGCRSQRWWVRPKKLATVTAIRCAGYHRIVVHHSRPNRALAVNWALALVLPAVGSALYWLWTATTITAHDCQTGSRGANGGLAVFAAVVLLAPAGVALQAWRTKLPFLSAALAALFGVGIALVAVFLTQSIWWSSHSCMT